MALGVEVTGGLARAHGHAEDAGLADRQHPGQGRDLAVVDDLEGHAPGRGQAVEDVADLGFEQVRRHGPEQGGDADLVADDDAGRRAADGVDAGEVGGGPAEALVDHAVVIIGIGLGRGRPGDLLAPDRLAVDDRGDLVVAGAEVEADAEAADVAPGEVQGLAGLREGRRAVEDDFERPAVDAAHDPGVEGARAVGRVFGLEPPSEGVGPEIMDAPAAARPEQELGCALDEAEGGGRIGVGRRGRGVEDRDQSVLAFDGQPEGPGPGGPGLGEVVAPGEDDGFEGRVAGRHRAAAAVRHLVLNSTLTGVSRRAASSPARAAQPLAPGVGGVTVPRSQAPATQ